MRSLSILLASTATTILVASCGAAPSATMQRAGMMNAAKRPTQSISAVYEVIANAGGWLYATIDLNKDGKITEAEAQTTGFADATLAAADFNHDAVLTNEEFGRWYSTKVGPASADAVRKHLAADHAKLDSNKDGFVTPEEAGIAPAPTPAPGGVPAIEKKLGHPLGLEVDGLELVRCGGFNSADFKAADETGDGKLVRSEFEDLWSLTIKRRLNVK